MASTRAPLVVVGERRRDAAFDLGADRLEQALGRVELRTIRRQDNERDADARHALVGVAGGTVPDDGADGGGLLRCPHQADERRALHTVNPLMPQPAGTHVHRHEQAAILALALHALADAHPAPTPAPPHLAEQAHLDLVRMHHHRVSVYLGDGEGRTEAPPFQASWAARSACSCNGRGTLGWQRSRASRSATPPGRYVTP